MKRVLLVALLCALSVGAKERKVPESVIKLDTVVTVKVDTTRTVMTDTLKITKTYNDTSILVKSDTVKVADKRKAPKK